MKTRRAIEFLCYRLRLMPVLLCLWSIPQLVGAAVLPIPTGPYSNGPNTVPDYYTTANWANSPPLAKFVDTLPGLGAGKANNLGQYLSVAKPDTVTYPGSDYYEIDLVQYREQMHSDLPAAGTLLRGYIQVNRGTDSSNCGSGLLPACSAANNTLTPDPVHYLGPSIVAQRDRPVRIKFTNRLGTGAAGDLFIPVDTSVMGSGEGPLGPAEANYTQNRATLHLHGGRTPWISDGTPHQWITPAGENTPYPKGVSVQNVPDMPDPGPGAMTFFYSNQQSARLMFYHDHAFGITRLNVYAGEAAGYIITDRYEQDLVARGLIPPDQIPLIIQDKTYVNATTTTFPLTGETVQTVRDADPLWNWGSGALVGNIRTPVDGDLWMPHVYMPAQNSIAGSGGVNPFGRWMYGPWFYPATNVLQGPVANPYYDPNCGSPIPAIALTCTTPGQPAQMPGTPTVSMGMEAFQDSVVVNGTVFPSLTVDPRAYRLRILNAAGDRFWNLSFYVADSTPGNISPDPRLTAPGFSNQTEVKTVPASAALAAANNWPSLWPVDGRDGGVPDPGLCTGSEQAGTLSCPNLGPSFLQFATEGGFLPAPVERKPQPVTYIIDPTAFWVGIVDQTGLALGPAERADTIVDFSNYAGKTLILYNDAPAAWPARVPGYDYFTGAPDMRDGGGYGAGGVQDPITGAWVVDPANPANAPHGVLPGYAPNSRTVLQVIVRPTAGADPAYDFTPAVKTAFAAEFTAAAAADPILNPAPAKTLFERAQEPIVVGQAAYTDAYPNSVFPIAFPWEGIAQINDSYLKFVTLAGQQVTVPMHPKGIHDEMGASFDPVYGRMSGNLAMQLPNPTTLNALLILYGYADLPTETINNSPQIDVQVGVVGPDPFLTGFTTTLADGTQIWKISHNGVDTHPIHFHVFDVQLLNRVGWDGQIAYPEANELGWKDTIKISPLMDTIIAVRPRAPNLPFGIPNSIRPLNPAIALGSPMGFNSVDWTTGQARVPAVTNILYDFKWEYVWHCHILSHEEMDMMRPIVFNVPSALPNAPLLNSVSAGAVLTWTDTTPTPAINSLLPSDPQNEIGFIIERCSTNCNSQLSYQTIARVIANSTTYIDATAAAASVYSYRVVAYNAAGSSASNVVGTVTGSMVKPTLSIAAPNGTTYSMGALNIRINATAAATAPAVTARVDFYINGGLYASSAAAPFGITIANASPGTLAVTAKAVDSDGVVSLFSNTLTINVIQTAAPASISVPAGSTTGTYTVSWTASATAGATYILEESPSAAFTAPTAIPVGAGGTALFVIISGKADSTQFFYRVKAVAASTGSSSWTVGANGCTVSYPTIAPASITVPLTSSTGAFTVTWGTSATPGATYTLEESTTAGFSNGTTVVVASGLAVTSRAISGKSNGTFYYRVKAVAAGYSTFPWTVGANGCTVTMIPVITAPAGGAILTGGIPATITAVVPLLAGSTVTRVEFYVDGVIAGTDAAAPYSIPWTPGTAGSHNLTVIAVYSSTGTGTVSSYMSDAVTVTVTGVAPTITLDSPLTGALIDLGTPTVITSTPSVIGPTLTAVVFYENGTFLNWAAPGATSISWTPTVAGARTLTALAYYNNLAVPATSAGTTVTINGTVIAPAFISVPTISTGTYMVSWTAAAPATAGATYTLEESTTAGFTAGTTTVVTSGLSTTSAAISGKAVGTYYYRVKGVKAPMTDSAWVSGAQGSTVVPAAPAILTAAGVFRNGQWYLDMNGNSAFEPGVDILRNFGALGDIPVTGIWNGAGTTSIGVFKNGQWTLDMNGNGTLDPGTDTVYSFGITGDIPVTGDWNGSGTTGIGVFRSGQWLLDLNGNGVFNPATDVIRNFGLAGDVPVTGDWNGTGATKIGIFRSGQWLLDMNGNGVFDPATDVIRNFGLAGDVPVTGDWNGTGSTKIGVFRNGQWLLDMNGNGVWDPGTDVIRNFGLPGDLPVTVNGMIVAPASITVPASGAAGAYTVSWSPAAAAPAGTTYTLEESTTAGFSAGTTTVVTSGLTAVSAAITGKTAGTYYYRVKAVKAPLADSIWVNGANGCSVLPAAIATTTGVFRAGQWYLDMNGNGAWDPATDLIRNFGISGDVPVTGIWNGAGSTKFGVFRNGEWYLDMNGNGAFDAGIDIIRTFGITGDLPVTGNWNGAGATKIGVFRNGEWYLDMNGNGSFDPGIDSVYSFGLTGDLPVTGDWSGSGTTRIGVFRNGQWFLDMNGNGVFDAGIDVIRNFGLAGDIPVTGDWSGSGVTRIGVYRNGQWFLDMNGNGAWDPGIDAIVNFGIPGDVPVTGMW